MERWVGNLLCSQAAVADRTERATTRVANGVASAPDQTEQAATRVANGVASAPDQTGQAATRVANGVASAPCVRFEDALAGRVLASASHLQITAGVAKLCVLDRFWESNTVGQAFNRSVSDCHFAYFDLTETDLRVGECVAVVTAKLTTAAQEEHAAVAVDDVVPAAARAVGIRGQVRQECIGSD